jgi:DNA-binding NtrC family response regulator
MEEIFVGNSRIIQAIYEQAKKMAVTDATILILGETGVGKGVLARFIHNSSPRGSKRYISITGAQPETLLESELFGHVKGAFTGAINDRTGLLETAAGGTVFLDDITNAAPSTQMKLLEVLEEKTIRRLGEDEKRQVDARFICATNMDLREEVEQGRFRRDLYYRINTLAIEIPPLRERRDDIMLLARHFLEELTKEHNKRIEGFDPKVEEILLRYQWPGNVRELKNAIERAVVYSDGPGIKPCDLPPQILCAENGIIPLGEVRTKAERIAIIDALRLTRGNIAKTARCLDLNRFQLYRLMKKYDIRCKNFKELIPLDLLIPYTVTKTHIATVKK